MCAKSKPSERNGSVGDDEPGLSRNDILMRILAIDTALGACSACVLDAADMVKPLAVEQIAMDRGHA